MDKEEVYNQKVLYNDYEEIDLRELFMLIWHKKLFITTIVLFCLLIAVIYSFWIAKPVYQVSSEIYTPDYTLINGEEITNKEYLPFFRKPDIEQVLINNYTFDINLEEMNKKLTIKENIGNDEEENNTVVLKLEDTDNELAAELLNQWVSLFAVEVKAYMDGINKQYLAEIKSLLTVREATYTKAQNNLTVFQKRNNLELLKKRLNTKNNKLVDFENRIIDIKNNIKILEEKNKLLAEQLGKTDKYLVTNESLDDSSMEALADILNNREDIKPLVTRKENVNDIYLMIQRLQNQVALDLTAKRKELQLIDSEMENLDQEIASLQEEVAILTEKLAFLELKVVEAKTNYQESEKLYSFLLQELKKNDYNILIISKAVVPENSTSPNKKLNLLIAGVLGIFLGVFLVLVRNFFTEDETAKTVSQ